MENTMNDRRDFLRAELELLSDEDLQEMVFDACCEAATPEANDGTRDPDDVYTDAEHDAGGVCNEGREAMIEWIVSFDFPAK